jgi:hypothetical protein
MLWTIGLENILQNIIENMLTKIKPNIKERRNMIETYRTKGIGIYTKTWSFETWTSMFKNLLWS